MASASEVEAVVRAHCSDFCDAAGDQNTIDIVSTVTSGKIPEVEHLSGGSDFDIGHALEVVSKVATFTNACFGIVRFFQDREKRKPTKVELLAEAKKKGLPAPPTVDPSAIAQDVIDRSG